MINRVTFKKYKVLILSLCFISFIYLMYFIFSSLGFCIVIQNTNSMPKGVYIVYPANKYEIADDVLLYPNKEIYKFLLKRKYLNKRMPLLKKIVADKGYNVCINENKLYINNEFKGKIYKNDRNNQSLPQLNFCKTLKNNEYYTMGISSDYSYDSRYFGIISSNQIIGKAKLLWQI